jgi:sec-independent protein translocase protein TatA
MNLGGQEVIIIFIIVLLLFGAKKIPELARGLGKSMGEFKKAKDEFQHEITRAQSDAEVQWERDRKKALEEAKAKPAIEVPKQDSGSEIAAGTEPKAENA